MDCCFLKFGAIAKNFVNLSHFRKGHAICTYGSNVFINSQKEIREKKLEPKKKKSEKNHLEIRDTKGRWGCASHLCVQKSFLFSKENGFPIYPSINVSHVGVCKNFHYMRCH